MSSGRLLAGAAILSACVLYGLVRCSASSRKTELIRGLAADFKHAGELIRLEKLVFTDICLRLSEKGNASHFWRVLASSKDGEARGVAEAAITDLRGISPEAADLIAGYFRGAGASDPNTEAVRAEALSEKLCETYEIVKKEEDVKMKLTRSLSVLAGIALALLIL